MKTMSIQEKFDLALKSIKGGKENEFYYPQDKEGIKKEYKAYSSNEKWKAFLAEMDIKDQKAYGLGGGQELKEKVYKGVVLPPKMASYGSSSRFVYTLLRKKLKNEDVIFEQKLPTGKPRSISNMDAFLLSSNTFIEAKCREIYDSPSPKYKTAFEDFYDEIVNKTHLRCNPKPKEGKNDATIEFFYDGKSIDIFDMKQTIAHILGIANACKRGVDIDGEIKHLDLNKEIRFVYLVYNPKNLEPNKDSKYKLSNKEWETIKECYTKEEKFIIDHKTFFKELFRLSLIEVKYEGDIDDLVKKFKVEFADQETISEIIN